MSSGERTRPKRRVSEESNGAPEELNGTANGVGRDNIAEIQRARMITATVQVVAERGVANVTVARVVARSGVSRRTFYECFEDRKDCFLAAFDECVGRIARRILPAFERQPRWRDRVRAALTECLWCLEDEPAAARLLIVEALGAGDQALEARRRVLAQIAAVVDEGRTEIRTGREPPPLTAEGVLGGVLAVVHARVLASGPRSEPPIVASRRAGQRDPCPLADLAGPLMAMIVGPYLGPAAAERELKRPVPVPTRSAPTLPADPFKDLPIRLTYRTVRVLSSIAAAPGASSKKVATASGITDGGQMSRLLARLQNAGLVHNDGGQPAKGEAKAWALTSRGEGVLHAVGGS